MEIVCTWPYKSSVVAPCPVWPSCDGDLCDGVWSLQKIAVNRAQRGTTTSLGTMLAWRGCGAHGQSFLCKWNLSKTSGRRPTQPKPQAPVSDPVKEPKNPVLHCGVPFQHAQARLLQGFFLPFPFFLQRPYHNFVPVGVQANSLS